MLVWIQGAACRHSGCQHSGGGASPGSERDVGLHKKTLIAACLGALALVLGVFASTRHVLVHSFATIEADEARQSLERVKQGLQMEVHQLRAAAEDNGHWDAAYAFVTGHRENFVAENFTRSGLDTMRVHVMWVGDNAGKTLVSITTRNAPAGELGQLDPELLNRIQKYASAVVPTDSMAANVRMMRVPDGVLAFSAVRVLRSNHAGPSRGLLVCGLFFDEGMTSGSKEGSQSPVKLI